MEYDDITVWEAATTMIVSKLASRGFVLKIIQQLPNINPRRLICSIDRDRDLWLVFHYRMNDTFIWFFNASNDYTNRLSPLPKYNSGESMNFELCNVHPFEIDTEAAIDDVCDRIYAVLVRLHGK